MKRVLLSRKTILTLMIILLCLVVLSYIIPQRMAVSEAAFHKWRSANPLMARAADSLGLHHIYTSPWFALPLCLVFLSLCFSSLQQFGLARRSTFDYHPPIDDKWTPISSERDDVNRVMRKNGFLKLSSSGGTARFVKHPWGYWGSFLLHFGFLLVIASSLLIMFTQKRAIIRMEDGETVLPGTPWSAENHGLLAEELVLPMPARLKELTIDFWETDDIREMQSVIDLIYADGRTEEFRIGINQPVWHGGLKWHQTPYAGDNFYLEFLDRQGRTTVQALMFSLPVRRDRSSYNEYKLDWMPFGLKGKYYADAERQNMSGRNPLLVLRLYDGENLLGELPLRVGESGVLGDYSVRLLKAARWTGILIGSTVGMPAVFAGFFIIILGAAIAYFTPQREFWARGDDTGVFLAWRAARFEDVFREEHDRIVKALGGKNG